MINLCFQSLFTASTASSNDGKECTEIIGHVSNCCSYRSSVYLYKYVPISSVCKSSYCHFKTAVKRVV